MKNFSMRIVALWFLALAWVPFPVFLICYYIHRAAIVAPDWTMAVFFPRVRQDALFYVLASWLVSAVLLIPGTLARHVATPLYRLNGWAVSRLNENAARHRAR